MRRKVLKQVGLHLHEFVSFLKHLSTITFPVSLYSEKCLNFFFYPLAVLLSSLCSLIREYYVILSVFVFAVWMSALLPKKSEFISFPLLALWFLSPSRSASEESRWSSVKYPELFQTLLCEFSAFVETKKKTQNIVLTSMPELHDFVKAQTALKLEPEVVKLKEIECFRYTECSKYKVNMKYLQLYVVILKWCGRRPIKGTMSVFI